MMLTKSVQFLLLEAQEEDALRVHPLRVECKYTVRAKDATTTGGRGCGGGGGGVGGRIN